MLVQGRLLLVQGTGKLTRPVLLLGGLRSPAAGIRKRGVCIGRHQDEFVRAAAGPWPAVTAVIVSVIDENANAADVVNPR